MKAVDIIEYVVLLFFLYTFVYGPVTGKQFVIYVAVLGFFMLSGVSWMLSGDALVVKEYKGYALPTQIIAIIIGMATIAYIWLF